MTITTGATTRGATRTTARTTTRRAPRPDVRLQRPVRQARTRRQRPGWTPLSYGLVAVVGALSAIGLVFILSASSVESLARYDRYWAVFVRQLMWEGVGVVAFVIVARLGYSVIVRYWFVMWTVTVLALVAVKTPLGVSRNGSTRWIGPRSFEVQPSEAAKLMVVAALAHVLSLPRRDVADVRATLGPVVALALPLIVLVMLEPDLGTTLIIAAAAMAVLWAGGVPARWMASISALGALFVAVSMRQHPYQFRRLTVFLDPSRPEGYHLRRSLNGIASGGWMGVGVGAGRSKWGFLPNAHTDFIYAVIAEEVGLIGALIVLALFVALGVVGLQIARRAPDRHARLLATGITAWIMVQALANLGAVTGWAPVTGVPLPFVSQGGTAFVALMVGVAVMTDIARRGVDPEAEPRRRSYTEHAHPSQRRASATFSAPAGPGAVRRHPRPHRPTPSTAPTRP